MIYHILCISVQGMFLFKKPHFFIRLSHRRVILMMFEIESQ